MGKSLRFDKGQIDVVDDAMTEVLRRKTPAERIRIGFSLLTSAYNMLVCHLKKLTQNGALRSSGRRLSGDFPMGLFDLKGFGGFILGILEFWGQYT